jgi:hypothetical protein
MKRVCCICNRVLGHVQPYENHGETHTYCSRCNKILNVFLDKDADYYFVYGPKTVTIKDFNKNVRSRRIQLANN